MPYTSMQVVLRDSSSSPSSYSTSLPRRVFSLNPGNNWTIDVGRSSTGPSGPNQAVNNARFGSKVMSRDHAFFSADPALRRLYVTDINSMHGTHMHGARLTPHNRYPVNEGDSITFGTQVDRGDMKYDPVEIRVSSTWLEAAGLPAPLDSSIAPEAGSTRADSPQHSEPEEHLDEEAFDSNSEVDRALQNESGSRFTAPESDFSDDEHSDYDSQDGYLDEQVIEDSPSSSPWIAPDVSEKPARDFESEPAESSSQPVIEPTKAHNSFINSIHNLVERREARLDEASEDDLDEIDYSDEDISYAGPGNLQIPTSSSQQRDPSPSDIVLARSSRPASAGIWATRDKRPQSVEPEPQSQRSEYAWAGHNQVLYDPPPPLPIMGPNYAHYAPISMGPTFGAQYYQPWHLGAQDHYVNPEPETSSSMIAPFTSTRKRKADDMSDDDRDSEIPTSSLLVPKQESQQSVEMPSEDAQLSQGLIPTVRDDLLSAPSMVVSTSQATNEEGPARKKQKRSESRGTSRRKTFVSYAATAVAGAAVGAVGMVLGLAALPADYFV